MCIAGAPFERVAIDILGPLPIVQVREKVRFTHRGTCSKWREAVSCSDQTSTTSAHALIATWITRYGAPVPLHSDHGRNSDSRIFSEVYRRYDTMQITTTRLQPRSNGTVERMHRTLLQHLAVP